MCVAVVRSHGEKAASIEETDRKPLLRRHRTAGSQDAIRIEEIPGGCQEIQHGQTVSTTDKSGLFIALGAPGGGIRKRLPLD